VKTPKPSPSPVKTPNPSPTPEPTPTPTPTGTPGSIVRPTPTPATTATATPNPRPTGRTSAPATPDSTPSRTDGSTRSIAPGAGTIGGDGGTGPGNVSEPLAVRSVRVGLNDTVFGEFAGFGGIEWAVPALALGVPGLLVIVALLAQGLIGVLWLTYARRRLRGLGVRLLTRSGRAVR
jgi:hypothetical protein